MVTTMKKRISILLVCLFMIGNFSIVAASDTTADGFITALDPFYTDQSEFTVFDKQGNEITEEFYISTKDMHDNNDWEGIKNYFHQNVSSLRHEEYHAPTFRNTDLAKTVTETLSGTIDCYDPQYSSKEVAATVRQTIYYNPNTYEITQYNNPTLISVSCDGLGYTYTNIYSNKINDYTVRLYLSIQFVLAVNEAGQFVYGDLSFFFPYYIEAEYERFNPTLDITP